MAATAARIAARRTTWRDNPQPALPMSGARTPARTLLAARPCCVQMFPRIGPFGSKTTRQASATATMICSRLSFVIRRPRTSTVAGRRTAARVANAGPSTTRPPSLGEASPPCPGTADESCEDGDDPDGQHDRDADEPGPVLRPAPHPGGDQDGQRRGEGELPDAGREHTHRDRRDEPCRPNTFLARPCPQQEAEHDERVGGHVRHEARRRAGEAGEGKDQQDDHDGRADPEVASGQQVRAGDAEPRHDEPECGERPRLTAGQPQERLHQAELPDERSGVPERADLTGFVDTRGGAHVDPVVVAREADGSRVGRQPQGDRDRRDDQTHQGDEVPASRSLDCQGSHRGELGPAHGSLRSSKPALEATGSASGARVFGWAASA